VSEQRKISEHRFPDNNAWIRIFTSDFSLTQTESAKKSRDDSFTKFSGVSLALCELLFLPRECSRIISSDQWGIQESSEGAKVDGFERINECAWTTDGRQCAHSDNKINQLFDQWVLPLIWAVLRFVLGISFQLLMIRKDMCQTLGMAERSDQQVLALWCTVSWFTMCKVVETYASANVSLDGMDANSWHVVRSSSPNLAQPAYGNLFPWLHRVFLRSSWTVQIGD
jgi:hypothetical protein